jgi:ketosteroid isomerase-like protein
MTPDAVVRELWARIEERDWAGLEALLDPGLRVEWPATSEVFLGPAAFVAVQSHYPEGWSIRVLRVVGQGDTVVSEVEVPHAPSGQVFRVASFFRVSGARIVEATEYWITVAGDEPPAWRAPFSHPLP